MGVACLVLLLSALWLAYDYVALDHLYRLDIFWLLPILFDVHDDTLVQCTMILGPNGSLHERRAFCSLLGSHRLWLSRMLIWKWEQWTLNLRQFLEHLVEFLFFYWFWSVFEIIQAFWRIWGNFDQIWESLVIFRHYRGVLEHFVTFCTIFWLIWTIFGAISEILEHSDAFRVILKVIESI